MTENASVATLNAAALALSQQLVNGGAAGANAAVASTFDKKTNCTVITLSALVMPLVDNAGVCAHVAKKILDFPKGYMQIDSVVANLATAKSSTGVIATWAGLFSLGSVAAAVDATLTSTEADVMASTAIAAAVAGVGVARGSKLTTSNIDGSVTPVDLYLNMIVNDTDHDVTTTPCNLLITGTITLYWRNLG